MNAHKEKSQVQLLNNWIGKLHDWLKNILDNFQDNDFNLA